MKGKEFIELEKLLTYIKSECISENVNMLTTYKLLQIVKNFFKHKEN